MTILVDVNEINIEELKLALRTRDYIKLDRIIVRITRGQITSVSDDIIEGWMYLMSFNDDRWLLEEVKNSITNAE